MIAYQERSQRFVLEKVLKRQPFSRGGNIYPKGAGIIEKDENERHSQKFSDFLRQLHSFSSILMFLRISKWG